MLCVAAEEEDELKKTSVVNWYLKEIESEIESEEELVSKKGLIEKVIYRLVHYVSPLCRQHTVMRPLSRFGMKLTVCLCPLPQDHILIELSQAGLKGSEPASTEEDVVLVVNPNYILED